MERHKVVLYNPECVFYTMPLSLLAVGSRLDPSRYDIRIVDARLEEDPAGALLAELDDALCLGVTVLTGAPILDALSATRAAKARHPGLPVIWGGWHPSLFPQETLAEAGIDALVTGQGEDTFAEILDRLGDGAGLDGIPGCHAMDSPPGAPRALRDINELPRHDYGLIPVESYFQRKGWRQVDYISSQGCRFRCTFCADPHVYKRGWFGLDPTRMGEEL
jgi:anaerobic magnesium-protoporphyrin IX monomethyl ester cyclase